MAVEYGKQLVEAQSNRRSFIIDILNDRTVCVTDCSITIIIRNRNDNLVEIMMMIESEADLIHKEYSAVKIDFQISMVGNSS